MDPIERDCFWLAGLPPRETRPLVGRADAEIAIVGAGFTGLWTAIFLKQLVPGLDVAVVEQGVEIGRAHV